MKRRPSIFLLLVEIFFTLIFSTVSGQDKWSLWSSGTKLRGANIYQRRVYPELDGPTFLGSGKVGPPYSQADIDNLAAWGANYVNISHPGLFTENPPYILDPDIQQNLDNLLDMVYQADMFAVISFRTGPGRSEFTFFWGEDGDWFDASYYNDQVWKSQEAQDAWVQMWAYAAQRYKNHPAVVGYDLMVEPNSNDVWLDLWDQEQFYQQYGGTLYDWNQFFPDILAAIRQVDAETPILVGGMGYSAYDWLSYIQAVNDERTIYTVHQYEPFVYTHQEPPLKKSYPGFFDTNWDGSKENFDYNWLQALFSTIDDFRAQHNRLVAINEFGAMRWEPGVADFIDDEMNLMEQRGMNYAIWLWETSWQEYAQEVDDFNFRHGPDPNHHADVSSSDLINVIKSHWAQNIVRPSNFYHKKYYVSVNGNDNNSGLSPNSAWRTISHAINMISAGDTVEILPGNYSNFIMTKSGTADQPIIIQGTDADEVTVSGIEIAKNVQYVTISDMTVQGFSGWGVFVRGTNRFITLERLQVFGGESGIHLTWGYSGQNPEDGAVSNIDIRDCIVANCIYTAIDGTPGPCDSLTLRNLEVYGAGLVGESSYGSDGIAVERGDFILVENCYVHDNGGDGIDLCSRNYSGNRQEIIVRGNRVFRNHLNGIKLWAGGRIENNFIAGMGNAPVDIGAYPGTYQVINNTIACNMRNPSYSVRNYSFVAAYPDDETGISASIQLTLLNNIFAFNCSEAMGGQTGIYLGEGVNLVFEGYNCFFSRSDGEIQAEFLSGDPWITREQITNGTWHTKTGQGTGDICLDPLFADCNAFDFRLTSSSPCIDAGYFDANYNDEDGTRNDMGGYGGPHGESYEYPEPANYVSISGRIRYFGYDYGVPNALIELISSDTAQSLSDETGNFSFSQVEVNKSYDLIPQKTGDLSQATILSFDASIVARLALNILPDTSAIQLLAADADKNGILQLFDASLIARFVVGQNDIPGSFVGNWEFSPASRTYVSLNQSQNNADFSAYIIGDADASWAQTSSNFSDSSHGRLTDWIRMERKPNNNIKIEFLGSQSDEVYSFDIEIKFDPDYYQLISQTKEAATVNFELTTNEQVPGLFRAGAYHHQGVSGRVPLFQVVFKQQQPDSTFSRLAITKYYVNNFEVLKTAAHVTSPETKFPDNFSLEQNYPNPFNQSTLIRYSLPHPSHVRITILNVNGGEIRMLLDQNQPAGEHALLWDGKDDSGKQAASGIYWYRIEADNFKAAKKLVLIR